MQEGLQKDKMKKFLLLMFVVVFLIVVPFCLAQEGTVDLYFFYGQGCPHCAAMESFLSGIEDDYPELNVSRYEVYFDSDNSLLLLGLAEAYGEEVGGVPTIFIDDKMIVGHSPSLEQSVQQEIERCISEGCDSPVKKFGNDTEGVVLIESDSSPVEDPEKTEFKETITVPAVLIAAVVDAINPCAFAVLIILLTTILVSGARKRSLYAGFAFTLSIFVSYFLMGVGLYSAIQATGVSRIFFLIVAVLAIVLGLFNLKDYLWYGKWFIMEVPMSWRPKLQALIKGVTSVPGAFMIGFVVSLFLLPCTSGPYVVILGLLAEVTTRNRAMLLLLLYNLVFVLPMILITLAVYFGLTTTDKAEKWRKTRLKALHLIAGLIMLFLGVAMILALVFGWV